MTDEQVSRFLTQQRTTMVVTTIGKDGWPHSTPLWYVMRESTPWVFTYAKSQKVKNLERDPRATLLVETGTHHDEARGVMLIARGEIHTDQPTVRAIGEELFARYGLGGSRDAFKFDERIRDAVRASAPKRVAIRFERLRVISWDHSKLDRRY